MAWIVSCLANAGGALFDRKQEMAYLRRFVGDRGQLMLMTGPPDCGKTAILRQLAREEAAVSLFDLRGGDFTSADDFTRKLRQELGRNKTCLNLDSLQVNLNVSVLGTRIGLAGGSKEHVEFQDVLWRSLMQRDPRLPVPTLIIDEADILQDWVYDKSNEMALKSFLRFFVKITKQDSLANVILSSSDYFFKYWLDKQIGGSRYSRLEIGDFPEEEARGFFDYMRGCCSSDQLWKSVYESCGGGALLLRRSANRLSSSSSPLTASASASDDDDLICWAEMKQELHIQAYDEVCWGLEPECLPLRAVPASWTPESYRDVIAAMCECEQGVMPWRAVQEMCGTKNAQALIAYNLILCRSNHPLGNRDLAWYSGAWPVTTPVSQAHLLAMRDLAAAGN